MHAELTVRVISSSQEEGVITVGLANSTSEATQYLLLMRTVSPSEQDRRLREDQVYIEWNDQLRSAYGCIKSCVVRKRTLEIALDSTGLASLGVEGITALLDVPSPQIMELAQWLRRLFKDDPTYLDLLET